ncbi:MAG: hypothetical protein HN368_16895, partial [Spirochaetales bacterium]|nr:hypothetical protein [Spirochaetales bacterium]
MKMIQVRNVPDDIHRRLKSRAALAGMTLSDYLLAELRRTVEKPTIEEIRKRLATRTSASLREAPTDAVRSERNAR